MSEGPARGAPDSLGMLDLTLGLAEQVDAAVGPAAELNGLPEHDDIENVVVLGVGGSGLAGDVLAAVAGPFMAVPAVVHKSYSIPNFIDSHSLVFAISFSGDTEETVEAATAAAAVGARLVVISGGGALGALADGVGAPQVGVPADIPMPRAGIGAVAVPPLVVLEQVGLFPGARQWIDRAVVQLRRRRDQLVAAGDPATRLAQAIGRAMPLAYGGGGIGQTAALRFKNQCNENAKIPAFANTYPELCHNEICGWGQHGDVTRQILHVVQFRHDFEHPQIGRRARLVAEVLDEVVAGVEEVVAEGEGSFAQLMDLFLFGDVVSLRLAAAEGVDPGPIPVLDDLKRALADPA